MTVMRRKTRRIRTKRASARRREQTERVCPPAHQSQDWSLRAPRREQHFYASKNSISALMSLLSWRRKLSAALLRQSRGICKTRQRTSPRCQRARCQSLQRRTNRRWLPFFLPSPPRQRDGDHGRRAAGQQATPPLLLPPLKMFPLRAAALLVEGMGLEARHARRARRLHKPPRGRSCPRHRHSVAARGWQQAPRHRRSVHSHTRWT